VIYYALKKWELMAIVAGKLAAWNPQEPGHLIDLAYAKRRSEGLHIAHTILTHAAEVHPANATIQFNLACYEAQLGNPLAPVAFAAPRPRYCKGSDKA